MKWIKQVDRIYSSLEKNAQDYDKDLWEQFNTWRSTISPSEAKKVLLTGIPVLKDEEGKSLDINKRKKAIDFIKKYIDKDSILIDVENTSLSWLKDKNESGEQLVEYIENSKVIDELYLENVAEGYYDSINISLKAYKTPTGDNIVSYLSQWDSYIIEI